MNQELLRTLAWWYYHAVEVEAGTASRAGLYTPFHGVDNDYWYVQLWYRADCADYADSKIAIIIFHDDCAVLKQYSTNMRTSYEYADPQGLAGLVRDTAALLRRLWQLPGVPGD